VFSEFEPIEELSPEMVEALEMITPEMITPEMSSYESLLSTTPISPDQISLEPSLDVASDAIPIPTYDESVASPVISSPMASPPNETEQPERDGPILEELRRMVAERVAARAATRAVARAATRVVLPTPLVPTILGTVPPYGPKELFSYVVILGSNFTEKTQIWFGRMPLQTKYIGPNTLLCIAPPIGCSGRALVTVTNGQISSNAFVTFLYY
jgi:hypothetical protein